MKKIAKPFPLFIVSATLLALAIFLALAESSCAASQDVQVFEMTAKKYEYSASPVHVKVGTKVQLKITAIDHDHGFKVRLRQGSAGLRGRGSQRTILRDRMTVRQVSFHPDAIEEAGQVISSHLVRYGQAIACHLY
jgi:hypothetical protein